MPRTFVIWTLCATLAGSTWARDPLPGDGEAEVLQALGEPRGWIRTQDTALLYYERGEIQLTNGVVARVVLVSENEATRIREESAALAEQRRLDAARYLEELQRTGQRIAAETLADPAFAGRPASERVAFWTDFGRLYPGVDISVHHQKALAEHRTELERAAQDERLRALEARVASAERRAADAEAAAQRRATEIYYPVYRYYLPWMTSQKSLNSQSPPAPAPSRQPVIVPGVSAITPMPWQHDFFKTHRWTIDTHIVPRH